MRENQQNIIMRKHEYGFSLVELIVVIAIMAAILSITVPSLKHISKKNQKKVSELEANKIYCSLLYRISKARTLSTITVDDQIIMIKYPLVSNVKSSNDYVDDFDYEFCINTFFKDVFNNYQIFENGIYEYERVNYTKENKSNIPNTLTYIVEDKGKFIFHILMQDGIYSGYDTLSINGLTYIDKYNNEITYYI